MSTDPRPSSSHAGSKPSGMWQPPTLEEMQAMLPQYQFESLLGRGGMGAVYKAVQVSLDRPVAIKVLPGDLIDDVDAQFAERFKNEARTMAKMNHPAIVNVYDFGETQTGLLFIVMEFIDGTDVSKMIASQGKLPPDYALAITAHVCDALNYAHSHSIVHRDIKPANILINMEGAVKVADFGLAKQSDAGAGGLTKTNMAMGTPDFVAPEALNPGMPLDGRADLYAIGVMLYQMLTGEIPRGMWTMPSAKLGTDPRFDAIIGKAMQTDRESRYQTAASIRRDLDVIMTTPPAAVKKPAGQGPQQPGERSAGTPARSPNIGGEAAKKAEADRSVRAPVKKSSTGFYLGMAATVIVLGAVVFLFSGGEKPVPAPEPAGKTKVVEETPAPKPKTPKPAPSAPTPRVPLTAPVPTLTAKAVEVLPILVLEQDVVYGDWKMQPDGLAYGKRKGKVNSIIELPFICSGSYVIEAEVSTVPTPGNLVFHLPFAKESGTGQDDISFMVDHAKGQRAGFAYFEGESLGGKRNPAWVDMTSPLGQKSRLTLKVELKKPGRIAFSAWRDGRPLVGWEGDRSLTTGAANVWRPANQPRFAIGTTLDGTVFHRIRVEVLDGDIQWLRAPATVAKVAPAPALMPVTTPAATPPAVSDTVDTAPWANAIVLMPLVDVEKDTVKEGWTREGGDLVSSKASPALVELPVIPPEEYDLRVRLTRKSGDENISVVLARGDRSFIWHGGIYANTGFCFGNYQGGPSSKSSNSTLKSVAACFEAGRAYTVQISVRKTGVTAYVDGMKVSELPADLAEMQVSANLKLRGTGTLGLGSFKSPYAVHAVELREVTGKAKLLREPPAADLVAQRLAQLEQQFQAAFERDAGAAYKAQIATLNTGYTAALDRELAAAAKAGKLDAAVALREEKQRIQEGKSLPPEDLDSLPESLKKLRGTWRGAEAGYAKQRDTKAAPLFDAYDRALDAFQSELTKQGKIDDALRVKTARDELTQRRGASVPPPNETPAPAKAVTSKPAGGVAIESSSSWRKAAEWILSVGGEIRIRAGGTGNTAIKDAKDLPSGRFDITNIILNPPNGKGAQITDDDLTRFNGLRGIEVVSLVHLPGVTGAGLAALAASADSMREVTIYDVGLQPQHVGFIAQFKNLKNLTFDGLKVVTSESLTRLGELKELRNLRMLQTPAFDDRALLALAGLTKLESFDTTNATFTDEGMAAFKGMKDLKNLSLGGITGVRGPGLAHIAGASGLTRLNLDGTQVADESLAAISGLKSLTDVSLSNTSVTSACLKHLGPLKQLRTLNLSAENFAGVGFDALAGCNELRQLVCGGGGGNPPCNITDDGLRDLAKASLPKLEQLSIKGQTITDAGYAHLTVYKLKSLYLEKQPGVEGMRSIATISTLETLNFGGGPAGDAEVAPLTALKMLKYLNFYISEITDAALPGLLAMPNLKSFYFYESKITPAAIEAAKKTRPDLKIGR